MTPAAPDVTAYELPAACDELAAAGWSVTTLTTSPSPEKRGIGIPRVVRQRPLHDRRMELVVAHTRYEAAS